VPESIVQERISSSYFPYIRRRAPPPRRMRGIAELGIEFAFP